MFSSAACCYIEQMWFHCTDVRGVWNRGTFVQQINVSQQQIQQSYNNIMQQSQNYAPQNSNTISLPPGTEIKEIDSSSELGSKLLGKMRK